MTRLSIHSHSPAKSSGPLAMLWGELLIEDGAAFRGRDDSVTRKDGTNVLLARSGTWIWRPSNLIANIATSWNLNKRGPWTAGFVDSAEYSTFHLYGITRGTSGPMEILITNFNRLATDTQRKQGTGYLLRTADFTKKDSRGEPTTEYYLCRWEYLPPLPRSKDSLEYWRDNPMG